MLAVVTCDGEAPQGSDRRHGHWLPLDSVGALVTHGPAAEQATLRMQQGDVEQQTIAERKACPFAAAPGACHGNCPAKSRAIKTAPVTV